LLITEIEGVPKFTQKNLVAGHFSSWEMVLLSAVDLSSVSVL